MGEGVSDPENPENFYNYPFGLWFFGSLVSKITGMTVFTGNFIVVFLYSCGNYWNILCLFRCVPGYKRTKNHCPIIHDIDAECGIDPS